VRLDELRSRIGKLDEVKAIPDLAIFGAGSYGRLEASPHSDIDMFFLTCGDSSDSKEPRTASIRLFGKMIEMIDVMRFPKFSNDCEYLVVLSTTKMLEHVGGRIDDHENYFTVRMLLLLESQCLYGRETFGKITSDIVTSYFRDFPDHKHSFLPMFLMNDICRFWKTLLLNYENKRNVPAGATDYEAKRLRQKVRNFKLKFSRMTTCFASIAVLGSFSAPVTEAQVVDVINRTPVQRLQLLGERIHSLDGIIGGILDQYAWFLDVTSLSTPELEERFADKEKRTQMFEKANRYGNSMYDLIRDIDGRNTEHHLLRNLVI
jgi:predicted nucleotidyltransferase